MIVSHSACSRHFPLLSLYKSISFFHLSYFSYAELGCLHRIEFRKCDDNVRLCANSLLPRWGEASIYIETIGRSLPWRTRKIYKRLSRIRREREIGWDYVFYLTPSLNLNYPKLRLLLNSSNGLAKSAFVKPSAIWSLEGINCISSFFAATLSRTK